MPFHFCIDELIALLAIFGFAKPFFMKMHALYSKWFKHEHCHKEELEQKEENQTEEQSKIE